MMDLHGGTELDVTVLGFRKPDFDLGSWKFVSMGRYVSAALFSDDIASFFNEFTDEYFIMGNDDVVLTNEFDHKFLEEIIETVREIPNFGRIWLTRGSLSTYGGSSVVKDFGDYQIAELKQSAPYRLSLQYSLWKTSYFKKYLTKGLSPWAWELRSTAVNDGAAILIPVNRFVVSIGHFMKKGILLKNWHKSIYGDGELKPDEIEICKTILTKHGYL